MSETKSSLVDQFSQAIQSVKNRITGYTGQVKQYKQGVNANADKLRELVDRLRECLEGLNKLKQNHEGFVTFVTFATFRNPFLGTQQKKTPPKTIFRYTTKKNASQTHF